jgi:hypothetical protein
MTLPTPLRGILCPYGVAALEGVSVIFEKGPEGLELEGQHVEMKSFFYASNRMITFHHGYARSLEVYNT